MRPLNTLTLSELVGQYNEAAERLGENKIKKFSDRKSAIRRTEAIVARLPKKRKRKPRGMRFVFKPETEIRACTGSAKTSGSDKRTLRQRCVTLLIKESGATFKQVEALVEKFDRDRGREPQSVERRAYELVRIMHYYLGYGIRELEGKRIQIYTNETA